MTIAIGQTVNNRYRIDQQIATGGMGTVYLAHDLRLSKPMALKVMHANIAADPAFQQRFQVEAQATANLNNPHIVSVTDYGQAAGIAYLVMEYVAGGSLRNLIERYGREKKQLPLSFVLEVGRQVALGLACAHAAGLIHRDIKPDNLLLAPATTPDGKPGSILKIADFGIVRQQQLGAARLSGRAMPGTMGYAAPEQIQGRPVDERSDIYALGVVLFELLAGELPPFADQLAAQAVLRTRRPDLSRAAEAIVLSCLEFEPSKRFARSGDLAQALQGAIGNAGAMPHLPTPTPTPQLAPGDLTQLPGAGGQFATPATYLPPGAGLTTPRIHIREASGQVRYTDLPMGGVEVGREAVGGIILADSLVSRRHLRIDWDGVRASVTDLDSSNGSQLNGQPLSANAPQPWQAKEALQIGKATLYLELPQSVPTVIAQASPAFTVPLPFAPNELTLAPKRSRSSNGGEHTLTLRNNGNAPVEYSLSAEDDELALGYRFVHDSVTLQPGDEAKVNLALTAKLGSVTVERIHQFTVTARPNDSSALLTVQGAFVQEAKALPATVPAAALASPSTTNGDGAWWSSSSAPTSAVPLAPTPAASGDDTWFLQAASIEEMRRKNRVRPLDWVERGTLANVPLGVHGLVSIPVLQNLSAGENSLSYVNDEKIGIMPPNWIFKNLLSQGVISYEVHIVYNQNYRDIFLVGYVSREQIATLVAFGARNRHGEESIILLNAPRRPHFTLVVAIPLIFISRVRNQMITF